VEGIVVGRRDRIELVVVAARAGDGQAEEALGRGVDTFVDGVVVVLEALADGVSVRLVLNPKLFK
jgi:hypothetical protein